MTHDEISELAKSCKYYYARSQMHARVQKQMITPEQRQYMLDCGHEEIERIDARQKIFSFMNDMLSEELNLIEEGLSKYESEFGEWSTELFEAHFIEGDTTESLAKRYHMSCSTIKRHMHIA